VKGFLFDENLPRRIRFSPFLPIVHATDLGRSLTDSDLWQYAALHQLAIISKDADFSERIFTSQPPPWVVHLCIGNLSRNEIHPFLQRIWPQIEAMLPSQKLISVFLDRIESVAA
jgi:predicted nuclease of predicted toxin-antitoxin system